MLNKVFFLLCVTYAIWSFAYAFAYLSTDYYVFSIWNRIAALGWCTFSSITLYLVLLITDHKCVKKRIVQLVIHLPAILSLFMTVIVIGDGIDTPKMLSRIFNLGNFTYNFSYLSLSMILLLVWGIRAKQKRIKLQARILIVSSIIPFFLNLLTQTILPLLEVKKVPLMGQIYSMIMIIGTYIVIKRYKFLTIPEQVVFEQVENRIIDMIVVVNDKGDLIKVSKQTLNMLGYQEDELLNRNITDLFNPEYKDRFSLDRLMQPEVRYHDVEILGKSGELLPIDFHSYSIWDKRIKDFLGAAIVMQDISIEHELRKANEELHQINIRDGLTNLYNHQYSYELLQKEIEDINITCSEKPLSLIMLDLDYFKLVNDTFGHLFGDYVLKKVAYILKRIVKKVGHVGRFGGEEFIIILPCIGLEKAVELAERIRIEIEQFPFEENLHLTVSLGVNQYKNQVSIDFVKETDDFLYRAKQNGRNRVEYE